jgi:disulfide oxidoreductase YuzD
MPTNNTFALLLLLCLAPACDQNPHMIVYPFPDGDTADAGPLEDTGAAGDTSDTPDAPFVRIEDATLSPLDGDTDVRTHRGLVQTVAEMYCASLERCCEPPHSPTCVEWWTDFLGTQYEAENFRAAEVDLYLRVLNDAYEDCDDLSSYEYDTLTPWRGPLEVDEECAVNGDCETLRCENVVDRTLCRPARTDDTRASLCR